MDATRRRRLQGRIANVFTPSTPTRLQAVFAGRASEREHLRAAILEAGRHAVIYGARGVGKTSLANVVGEELSSTDLEPEDRRTTIRVACAATDDFDAVWRRALSEALVIPITGAETVVTPLPLDGSRPETDVAGRILDAGEMLIPSTIERLLRQASRAVFVFDEYDVLTDREAKREFAELIKANSDFGTGPTIILVGVSHDISALLEDHSSVERCLEQIQLPPLSDDEVRELVTRGYAAVGMEIAPEAVDAVVSFSRGFPAFAHSLAKKAGESALEADSDRVESVHVFRGALEAMQGLPFSLGETYAQAVESKHPNDATRTTLVACAWVGPGRFRPNQVLEQLQLWGRPVTMPTLMDQLRRLATPARGDVLIQHGETRPSFEFRDPMMIPFIVIRELNELPSSTPESESDAAVDS